MSGRIACEAYRAHAGGVSPATGTAIPVWAGLSAEIRAAWAASEFAVRRSIAEALLAAGTPPPPVPKAATAPKPDADTPIRDAALRRRSELLTVGHNPAIEATCKRDAFGAGWNDLDSDGRDERAEIPIRFNRDGYAKVGFARAGPGG